MGQSLSRSGSYRHAPPVLPVFDGHNDALTRFDYAGIAEGRPRGDLDLPRMRAGGVRAAIFAVFTPSEDESMVPVPREDGVLEFEYSAPVAHVVAAEHAARAAGRLAALERRGLVRIVRTVADLDRVREHDGPPAAVLHLEGAEAIDPGLEALDHWHAAGLRSLGPVWSRANAFAHGVPFISPSSPDTGPGLTQAGRELVARCAELGIVVDLSHLNEAGFWDIARADVGPLVVSHTARADVGPLVVSHTAAHALCPTSRNLTDRQLDAVGSSSGLVGIVFACPFLRPDFADDPDTPMALIVEHARYVAERIGVEHVGLGSDFDGATIPAELGDVAGIPRLMNALADSGFDEHECAAIAWGNWRRVLDQWWR